MQIQLAPPWQGAGLGAGIIGSLLQEAQQARVPLRLSVLKVNRARNLHAKLGSIMGGEDDKSFEMIWRPKGVA